MSFLQWGIILLFQGKEDALLRSLSMNEIEVLQCSLWEEEGEHLEGVSGMHAPILPS